MTTAAGRLLRPAFGLVLAASPALALAQMPTAPPGRPTEARGPTLTLDAVIRTALEQNPRLGRAALAVDAARGRYTQAGLYPNPIFAFAADELGDRTGPPGILSPQVSQEVVRGGKLRLAQAVAAREIDQASLALLAERYELIGDVRAGFYEVVALRERAAILRDLVRLADEAVGLSRKAFEAKQVARLDLVQLEVEAERFRADAEAVEQELPAALRRLTATVGDPRLPLPALAGALDGPLPEYDLGRATEAVLAAHPEVLAARVGVERARAALRRAEAEPVPNVTVAAGYTRQSQNRSNDWLLGMSVPLPTWNRNQGNVRAAQAEVGMAGRDVGRVENELAGRLALAFRAYAAAKRRAERYTAAILPRAEETYALSLRAFRGGEFEYLRVLQAQRAVAEARLEANRSLGEAWRAAAELSGLLLEEVWPPAPGALPPPSPAR
jgi:cobalt-zinc-cadmium efflux system outer membrane protein